jgi:hypothetical protein
MATEIWNLPILTGKTPWQSSAFKGLNDLKLS